MISKSKTSYDLKKRMRNKVIDIDQSVLQSNFKALGLKQTIVRIIIHKLKIWNSSEPEFCV